MADLNALSAQAESDISNLYRARHANCIALAANDRLAGNLSAHKLHMEGAASVRRQFAAKLREMRQREAQGYVLTDTGFDCTRLFQNGQLLSRAEIAKTIGGAV